MKSIVVNVLFFILLIWFSSVFNSIDSQLTFKPKDGSWTPQGKKRSDFSLDSNRVKLQDVEQTEEVRNHMDSIERLRDNMINRLETICHQLKFLQNIKKWDQAKSMGENSESIERKELPSSYLT